MRLLLPTLVLTTSLSAQAAEIYCNAQGRECTDRPTASANIPRSPSAAPPAARTDSAAKPATSGGARVPATSTATPPEGDTKADPVAEQQRRNAALAAANKSLQKDLADKRSEQCRKAQDYYKQAIEATTIYRAGKDGKKEVLSEAEANQSRLNAKLEIERTCNKGGS